jgi:Glycosyl hydrolase family 26
MAVRLVLAVLAVALAAACSAPAASAHRKVSAGSMLTGVYEPLSPGSTWQVSQFAADTGEWPAVNVYYSKWGQPFAAAFAKDMAAHDGKVLVQIDPDGISLASIANGSQDSYLKAYAAAVLHFERRVIISFGQEMNGTWYAWGAGHVVPSVYIAAWRHVVDVFRAAGASNVTWLWDVNCAFPGSTPVSDWWPGSAYVTWAAVDCYYARPSDTFASLFGPIIASVRQVTSKPLLIAETGVGPDSGQEREAQIHGLFAGAKSDNLLGVIWFDESQNDGPYHQDWRLEDNLAALAAFRAAEKEYG